MIPRGPNPVLVLGTNHARLGCIPEPETPKEWDAGM